MVVFKQETATFSPVTTVLSDFERHSGDALDVALSGTQTEYAGAVDKLRAEGATIAPTTGAWALSGGPIADEDLESLLADAIAGLDLVLPVDGVVAVLHGAMASNNQSDPEGLLLEMVRSRVGRIPVVASLDLHAVLTDRMMRNADALVAFHTYPHTDQYETGRRAGRALLRLLAGSHVPDHTVFRLPLLVRGDELLTETGLFGKAIARCRRLEELPEVLAAAALIGNPFTDVPDLATNVIVTTTEGSAEVVDEAQAIAAFLWDHREKLRADLLPIEQALEMAAKYPGPTVLSDGADATSSGAPGDSNQILARLLCHRLHRSFLVPIVDAPAAKKAHEIGVGGAGTFFLGGSLDPARHTPIAMEAVVAHVGDGEFNYEDGTAGRAGLTAVLKGEWATVLVTERPVLVVGRKVFADNGVEPLDFDIIVVKSPNGYRAHYHDIGAQFLAVDVPGCTTANLAELPYEKCNRPIWPLDVTPSPEFLNGDP